MMHLVGFMFLLVQSADLKVKNVLFKPAAVLVKVVGPQDMSVRREFGMTFKHKGFHTVWIDAPGPKMKEARFGSDQLKPWKGYLRELGLDGAHASASPDSVPPSPLPRLRGKLNLSGVGGLPPGQGSKPWKVSYIEYAIANKDRLRALRDQITAQPVGEGRNKLIRSCYDWFSELDFSAK